MYYNDLNKNELVDLCKKRGLSSTGNKPALVSRLLKAEKTETKTMEMFTQPVEVELDVKPTKTVKVAPKEIFYLHLKSSNLSNYFNFGYFYPLALEESEIYKNENRAKDILSEFEDYLIVCKSPINKFESSDAAVPAV